MIETTSPSYVLMASLDMARKLAATQGRKLLSSVINAARLAREKLSKSPGIRCLTEEYVASRGFRYDPTRLVVSLSDLHVTGFEVSDVLRQKYKIEVEFADIMNIVAILTMIDMEQDILDLVQALCEIGRNESSRQDKTVSPDSDIKVALADLGQVLQDLSKQAMTPREAMFSSCSGLK